MSELDLIRESAVGVAARRLDMKQLRARRGQLPGYDPALLREMAELGWLGAVIPEELGGLGLGFAGFAAIAEALGGALLGEPLIAVAVLAPRLLLHGDNPGLKQRLLPAIASGERLAAVAWQETATGWDPAVVATTADVDMRLTGRKRFVAGSAAAAGFLVTARSPDGLAVYWVAADAPGLTVTVEWRADGTPVGSLELRGVTAAGIVASPEVAAAALRRTLDEAAAMAAAELVGVMSRALDIALDYMRTREQFGRRIGSFQALQHKAVDLHLQRELARASLESAVAALDGEVDAERRGLAVSRAKARCNEAALKIGRDAVQLHGAIGFTDECDIGLYLKRALVLAAWLGNADAQRRRFASLWAGRPAPVASRPEVRTAAAAQLGAVMQRPPAERGWNDLADADFRALVFEFFDRNLPQPLRFLSYRAGWRELKDWYLTLSAAGWLAPGWAVEHGGMGLGIGKQIIYTEEAGRVGAPRVLDHGLNNVYSILSARGTEEQRRTYLPKILSGEHIWCQGYSEPGSGSDLASLRTEAVLDGDEWVINGQKIWTTLAHEANHIYALVRTDKTAKKHAGISFLLVDLRQPGVTVRPIRNIAGHLELCEVFFDNVRTPRDSMVGAVNDGWNVSRAVLGFERLRVGAPQFPMFALQRLERVAARMGLAEDPVVADRIAAVTLDVLDQVSLYERYCAAMSAGLDRDVESSLLKIWATETMQRINEILVEATGDAGTVAGRHDLGDVEVDLLTPFLDTRSATIYGGTSQINRNILAKRVLNLP